MSDIVVQGQITALTTDERTELEQLESVIERGKQTFVEVGNALMEIREKRLYRETHPTFEAYTQERWDFSASRARQLIGAAQVVASLPEVVTGVTPPITEAHARPLAALAPDSREQVWRNAVLSAPDGKVTLTHVQAVVDQALGKVGRFDNKLVYAVNKQDHIVYLPGYNRGSMPVNDGRFHLLIWVDGTGLNQTRGYDAYELKEMPSIPALPEKLAKGFWLDRERGQLFPIGSDDRVYRLRRMEPILSWCAEKTWRAVQNADIRTYEICEPEVWHDPAWIKQSRFQPDGSAWCPVCGNVGSSWSLSPYEQWLPHPEKSQWLCKHNHWIDDSDIVIDEPTPETPAQADTSNALTQMLDYEDSEAQVLDEIEESENLIKHLVTMPDLVSKAIAFDIVTKSDREIGSETLEWVETILAALDLQRGMSLSQKYAGVLAYFQFMPGWYYAVDQAAKIVYGQADAEADICEKLFPECIAVKGSSLIEDREIYLKGRYRLVIEIVERK